MSPAYPPPVVFADAMPQPEAGSPAPGSVDAAARIDHRHERITWSGIAVTNASGVATFDFSSKPFAAQPVPVLGYIEMTTTAQPVILHVNNWVMGTGANAGKYVGCTVRGQRGQAIPTNLVTLLLGGVFNLFAASASGVSVSLVLIPQS